MSPVAVEPESTGLAAEDAGEKVEVAKGEDLKLGTRMTPRAGHGTVTHTRGRKSRREIQLPRR